MILVSSCSCLCPVHWSKVKNEDVVGAVPSGNAPTTSEWSTILLPIKWACIRDLPVVNTLGCYCLRSLCHMGIFKIFSLTERQSYNYPSEVIPKDEGMFCLASPIKIPHISFSAGWRTARSVWCKAVQSSTQGTNTTHPRTSKSFFHSYTAGNAC